MKWANDVPFDWGNGPAVANNTSFSTRTARTGCGKGPGFPSPPAQIRMSGIAANGSYWGVWRKIERWDTDAGFWVGGRQRSTRGRKRSQANRAWLAAAERLQQVISCFGRVHRRSLRLAIDRKSSLQKPAQLTCPHFPPTGKLAPCGQRTLLSRRESHSPQAAR